ncbi:MAG: 3-hydroxyacyl-CoA dehydrogenase family protein [Solirubrobacteraceae bacterium]
MPAADRVAVLGTGLMGAQIACEYALAGMPVVWIARERLAAQERVERALALAARERLASEDAIARARRLLSPREGPPGSEGPLTLIVESLPERLELKAPVLAELAQMHPDAIVATNTSSISVTELARAAGVEQRAVGTHYWNPPLLMPLVEVVAAASTPPAVLEQVLELLRLAGKRPVTLEREVPGLIWNRIQLAVLRECQWLVREGVAAPAAIDEVMRDGLARRWRLTGPFETVGLGGAAVFDAIAENLFPLLSNAREGSGFGDQIPTDPELLAELRARRDAALAAELRAERGAD